MTLGVIPGIGGVIPPFRIPRVVGVSQRAGGVPLGTGTLTFTDTNGFTQLPGATDAIVMVRGFQNSVDTSITGPALTVNGVAGVLLGTAINDLLGDNANHFGTVWLLKNVQGTGNVVYSQTSVNSTIGYIWGALHLTPVDTTEDAVTVGGTTLAAGVAKAYTNLDSLRPCLVVAGETKNATGGVTTPPAGFTVGLDLAYSTAVGTRLVLSYGYEFAPVVAKTYSFISTTADGRHGGTVATLSKS